MMEKLNELVEQAKFVADWYGRDWSSALCQDKDGKQAHEIICESRGEAVISTGSNSNEASWFCDYLELCSPANILAIAEAFRALEQHRDALAAENGLAAKAVQTFCDVVGSNTDVIAEEMGIEGAKAILAAMSATGNMPATDAYLNSVRAEGVEIFAKHCDESIGFIEPEDETLYTLMEEQARNFAAQLRAGEPS